MSFWLLLILGLHEKKYRNIMRKIYIRKMKTYIIIYYEQNNTL